MKKQCKAKGGSIYERQMNGETKSGGHANYESDMRGERAVSKPNLAIGGVGKVRHNQATMSGKPKAPRSKANRMK